MKRLIVLLIAISGCAMAAFAADPLIETIKIEQAQTAAFEIVEEGPRDNPYKLKYRVNGNTFEVTGKACIAPDALQPNISFDNATTSAWRIRFHPAEFINDPRPPCTLQCAKTDADLIRMGLCDRFADGQKCATSAKVLGGCIGPECDIVRAKCTLAGPPGDRTCTVDVKTIIDTCEATRCEVQRDVVKADAPAQRIPSAYEKQIYGRETIRGPLPSVGFPPESLGQPPYNFTFERTGGTETLALEVIRDTTGCGVRVPLVEETTSNVRLAVVPLDNTGVGSWSYLNPRNPACLNCDKKGSLPLAFVNRTGDRVFNVSVEFPAEVAPYVRECALKPKDPCKVVRTVQPNTPTIFESRVLNAVPDGVVLKFQVEFFDETEKPANPVAYILIAGTPIEPKSELQTAFITSIGGSLDPFVASVSPPDEFKDVKTPNPDDPDHPFDVPDGKDDATGYIPCSITPYIKGNENALCPDVRIYDGEYARHYAAVARIELSRPLGTRADFTASVNYRTSDLGVDDGNTIKLSEYGVNIYGKSTVTLRFGRTLWANPGSGIAIMEKGDGYRLAWRNFSIAHVIKRESQKAPADPPNKDNRSLVGQMKAWPIRFGDTRFLRGLKLLDVTAVYGEDKVDHVYRSIGGEVFYTYTNLGCKGKPASCTQPPNEGEPRKNWGTVAGTVAAFHSTKHLTSPPPTDATAPVPARHGKGWVGLLTTTWTPTTQKNKGTGATEAVRSYTLLFGKGSSDDPNTSNVREDYVGETGSFAANTLLMGTFLGKIDTKDNPVIGSSLANKTLIGLQVTQNTWSPLVNVAHLFGQDDITSSSMTARVRQFKFGRAAYPDTNSREAVREYALEFLVEVPKGVKVTIGGGYLERGDGLKPVLDDDAWFVASSISLRI